jgi:predicted amidohydrolase
MTSPNSISVAQTCPIKGEVEANLAQHLELTALAASHGAQIIVFPELSLTGYEIELARELAFSEHDSRLARLVNAASCHSITMIVGAPARIESRLHIAAFIFRPDRTTTLYTKHHLGAFGESARCDGIVPPAESTVFHAGDRSPLIQFAGSTAAVAICADIAIPSHSQQAAQRGAKVYIASMFVIPSDFEGDSEKLRAYARQHAMVVALANFGCATGGLAAAGRSSVWSEKGELVAQLSPTGAGVAVATQTSEGWRARTIML